MGRRWGGGGEGTRVELGGRYPNLRSSDARACVISTHLGGRRPEAYRKPAKTAVLTSLFLSVFLRILPHTLPPPAAPSRSQPRTAWSTRYVRQYRITPPSAWARPRSSPQIWRAAPPWNGTPATFALRLKHLYPPPCSPPPSKRVPVNRTSARSATIRRSRRAGSR